MRRRGLVLAAIATALLLIAATIRSGWLYLVASVLLSLVALGVASGWSSTRLLLLSRESRGEAFEGEEVRVRLHVTNGGRLTRYFLLFTDTTFALANPPGPPVTLSGPARRLRGRRSGPGEGAAALPTAAVERIAPGASVEVEYRVTAPRRGVYEGARVTVSSGGMFGAAGFSRSRRLDGRLVVYPRACRLAGFPFEPGAGAAPLETLEWSRKGAGQEYYGIREYQRGDALRDIHWRSTARIGELIVKEHRLEFQPSACVAVLLHAPGGGGPADNSLEDGLRCAASILDYYEAIGARPRLALPAGEGVEWVEAADPFDNLAALAAYSPPPAGPRSPGSRRDATAGLGRMFAEVSRGPGSGGTLALVTNAPSRAAAAFLREAEAVEGTSLVLVIDGSYTPGWDTADTLLEISKLETSGGRGVQMFAMTRGREIGQCLSAPLSVTAR